MYLRHSTVRRNGATHSYWRLVRSVRTGRKVRQETVAYLGELDGEGRLRAKALADVIVGIERAPGLFDEPLPEEPVQVKVRELRVERGRRFGDVWLGWQLWQALELDRFFERHLRSGREEIPWPMLAAILVVARLCEPSSELHIAEDWLRRTALGDLLTIPEDKINDDRLYRGMDRLLPHKEALEGHIKERIGTLFDQAYDLLLYDITSTYFEGTAATNPLAQRGHSRDHRRDCKQVLIGLVVSRDGFPLGYEIFAGNRNDSTTFREVVERMERRHGKQNRIWVVDRGMVKEDHIAWLKQRGSRYIVGTPRSRIRRFATQVTAGTWTTLREGLEVQLCPDAAGDETFLLCRSQERRAKEQAQRERFARRIEHGLQGIMRDCTRSQRDPAKIERRVGRLLGQNSRAARLFEVTVQAREGGGTSFSWRRRPEQQAAAEAADGCYVLRSSETNWTEPELWQAYMQLTEAENAFRIHKSDLCVRPVWHQKADRVKAHIMICFLAYVLRKTLEGWSKKAGLGNSPNTLMEELARIQSTDIVAPTTDGRTLRLRCVVRPDRAQTILLDRLGLTLPQRLQLPHACTPIPSAPVHM